MEYYCKNISSSLAFDDIRYLSISLLPALIGTTLPFWLHPPGFNFRLLEGILFIIMIGVGHIGFSFLLAGFKGTPDLGKSKKQLLLSGCISIIICVTIGLYLNSTIELHSGVPEYIFILYGLSTFFLGVLYVLPPFNFYRRFYGEIMLGVGLGLMPILGAYLVQVGDITRSVYLVSIPIVVVNILWIWIIEIIHQSEHKKLGYQTTNMYLPDKFSKRIIIPLLVILIYGSLILAVLGRSSLNPFALLGIITIGYTLKIIKIFRNNHLDQEKIAEVSNVAFLTHLIICMMIILSSVLPSTKF